MSDKNDLQEFKADHSGGDVVKGAEVYGPVTGAGGEIKKKLADVKKKVDPSPKKVANITPGQTMGEESEADDEDCVVEEIDITEAFASIFEGTDISEEVVERFSTIFEAAVNEAAEAKVSEVVEEIEEHFEAQLAEAVNETMEEIVENLDNYLDYVVAEWMEENAIAIESGIKVEMAESFMEGLKELFYEHNIEIDEGTVDVVSALEDELEEAVNEANKAINNSIELSEELDRVYAELAFREVSEGLTTSQVERLRILSEKLDISDVDAYASDLSTLKESFFKKKPVITESVGEEEEELITEEARVVRPSQFDSVNAIASFLDKYKK